MSRPSHDLPIYIAGPGGVGKSTVGPVLAKLIGYRFLDVDSLFCDCVENITDYIRENGYIRYCHTNSQLFKDLLASGLEKTVIALPSGFLVHEECPKLACEHEELLMATGHVLAFYRRHWRTSVLTWW